MVTFSNPNPSSRPPCTENLLSSIWLLGSSAQPHKLRPASLFELHSRSPSLMQFIPPRCSHSETDIHQDWILQEKSWLIKQGLILPEMWSLISEDESHSLVVFKLFSSPSFLNENKKTRSFPHSEGHHRNKCYHQIGKDTGGSHPETQGQIQGPVPELSSTQPFPSLDIRWPKGAGRACS